MRHVSAEVMAYYRTGQVRELTQRLCEVYNGLEQRGLLEEMTTEADRKWWEQFKPHFLYKKEQAQQAQQAQTLKLTP